MSKNSVVRLRSFQDLEEGTEEDGVGEHRTKKLSQQQARGIKPPRSPVLNDELRSDLPFNVCLRPGCKGTFRIPWGYHEGVKPEHMTDEQWGKRTLPLWPGACTKPCFDELIRLRKEQSERHEAMCLAKWAAAARRESKI
jgi:hypothetical protein